MSLSAARVCHAIRPQGWTLIQWTADRRQHGTDALEAKAKCERHVDLFRVDANASRAGRLREELTTPGEHPFVLKKLRGQLAKVMRLPKIRGDEG
jgi:hypothetical protein